MIDSRRRVRVASSVFGRMLLFLVVMLIRFRDAKLAAATGWALSLLPAAGLAAAGWDYPSCAGC